MSGPWRHLARAVAALGPHPADEALHEIRIRAKRLRYACEAVADVVGKPAVELARAAADLQGVLGDFHDAIVAEDWLRDASAAASSGPGPGRRPADRPPAAGRRPAAGPTGPTSWKRLNRKKQRAWLTLSRTAAGSSARARSAVYGRQPCGSRRWTWGATPSIC